MLTNIRRFDSKSEFRSVDHREGECAFCEAARTLGVKWPDVTDPSVVVAIHVSGVPSRPVPKTHDVGSYSVPPRIRACSNCGALYVAALAGVPEPPRPPRSHARIGFGDDE